MKMLTMAAAYGRVGWPWLDSSAEDASHFIICIHN